MRPFSHTAISCRQHALFSSHSEMSPFGRFVLLCSIITLASALDPDDVKPKEYIINLDLPAEDRWVGLLEDRADLINQYKTAIKLSWNSVPLTIWPTMEDILERIENYLPEEYRREIRGIASHLNISFGDVVLPNILYDLLAFCTSIIAQDDKGNIWHGRNLDFDTVDVLRNLIVVVHFQRKGKLIFSASTYVGLVGVVTGLKPGKFSISLDERGILSGDDKLWKNIIMAMLNRNAKHGIFFVRDLLETKQSFDEVLEAINDTDTIAPGYYIVAGNKPDQGTVVTRSRLDVADDWRLDTTQNRWYLVETNYDHWKPAPETDNRRDYAIEYMDEVGQANLNASTMYKVLSTDPVLRKETIYTTVMSAGHPGMFSTMIRYFKQ